MEEFSGLSLNKTCSVLPLYYDDDDEIMTSSNYNCYTLYYTSTILKETFLFVSEVEVKIDGNLTLNTIIPTGLLSLASGKLNRLRVKTA